MDESKNDVRPVAAEEMLDTIAEKLFDVQDSNVDEKRKCKVEELILKTIQIHCPPFPQRLKKKQEEGKYQKFSLC